MRKMFPLLVLGAAFSSGCVVYDVSSDSDCDWDDAWGGDCFAGPETDCDADEDADGVPDCEQEEPEIPVEMSFSPGYAEQGEVFPAVVTLHQGDFDLSTVTDVTFFGDVHVLSATADADQMILVLQVAEDAELGTVDLALDVGEDGHLMDAALTIHESESGNSALDWTDGADDCE
jgi:hypothetical protein